MTEFLLLTWFFCLGVVVGLVLLIICFSLSDETIDNIIQISKLIIYVLGAILLYASRMGFITITISWEWYDDKYFIQLKSLKSFR